MFEEYELVVKVIFTYAYIAQLAWLCLESAFRYLFDTDELQIIEIMRLRFCVETGCSGV